MKRLSQLFVFAAIFALLSPLALGGTYKWTDDEGNTVYSQQPPPDRDYQRLDIRTGTPSSSGQKGSGSSSSSAAESIREDAKKAEKQKEIEAQQAKAEEIRKKNCEVAKHNLQIYTVYRRVRDEEGNMQVIGAEEREQKIQQAKDQIAEFCD